jgi:hypothetical protein
MEFLKCLDELSVSKERRDRNDDDSIRIFQPIDVDNNVRLSIQASEIVSCRPKKTLNMNRLSEYTHMEVAIFKNDSFARLTDICPDFRCLAEFETYKSEELYAFVPVDLIDELFQHLVLKRDERKYV